MEVVTSLRPTDVPIMTTIPEFPQERVLVRPDITSINSRLGILLGNNTRYSDFNMLSLWGYNTKDDLRLAQYNGNMVFKMRNYITNQPIHAFCGTIDVNNSLHDIFQHLEENNETAVLELVPEETAKLADADRYDIQEDPNNQDYIYNVHTLATEALLNHKFRNFVTTFPKKYPDVQGRILNLEDEITQGEMLRVFNDWSRNKKEDPTQERTALQRTISCAPELDNILPIGLYDKDKLIGFMITDMTEDGWAQGHFAKADITYKGIYSYLYHTVAKELEERGIKHLNLEQDLGLPGLKEAKRQMGPEFFLKKYVISPK